MAKSSGHSLQIVVVQLSPTLDVAANVVQAAEIVIEAARANPDLVLLPENCLGTGTNEQMRASALAEDSAEIGTLCRAAVEANTTVVLGGFKRIAGDGRIFNTAAVIGPNGRIVGRYDKIHLFDASVDGTSYRASSVETRGTHPVMADIAGVGIGITICYDVRFPALYRQLARAGAKVFLVPSAFTATTGRAHWEVLNRARAIENGAYVVASAIVGEKTYGHALVVDPWGQVVTDLGTQPRAWDVVKIDMARVVEARRALPVLKGVQPEACAAGIERIDVPMLGGR